MVYEYLTPTAQQRTVGELGDLGDVEISRSIYSIEGLWII